VYTAHIHTYILTYISDLRLTLEEGIMVLKSRVFEAAQLLDFEHLLLCALLL
jgi:hypothetical protein